MQYRKRMIRKGTALLLSALLLASAMPFAVSAEEVSAKTTEYVNFRTGPGTNYSSKGVIPSGTGITVTDTSNSEWYAVRLSDGSTGYIYAEYISVSGSNTTEDGEVNAKTTADVNFRSGPGTNYNSKAVIGSGTGIIVTDTGNSQWYAVRLTNGSTGYIYAEYIRITGDVGTPSVPAEPTPAPSNPEAEQTAKTTEYVNFRTGPGTNYSSKGVISLGTTVTVTDTSNSQWYAVRLSNGSTGYIFAQYLKFTGNTSAPTATPAPSDPANEKTAKTTEYVNFRTGPGTNYSSKGVISLGTTVTVTDTSNSQWYAVRLANGSTGYIFAQYIKITSTPSATATPAPTPTPAPSDPSKEQTAKTTEYVNFRTGPGTNYSSKGVIPSGTAITVTDTSNSQWYAVRLSDGSTGYIFAQYIKITSATAPSAPTEAPADGTVRAKTTADVNLRKGAGTNYGVIRVVGNNTAVTVTEATNTWYKVKLSNGTEGYLYAQYVTVTSGDINSVKKEETTDPSTLTEAEQKAKAVLDTIGWDLRAAYNWSAHALPYYTLGPEVTGNSVHSEWYANFGFDNHKGNCYVMAATFQKMAKLLGYDAHLVEGYIRTYNGRGRHGWVEIDMNGTTYVFDPNFEYGGYGNGYQINYGMSGTFKYIDYARVD
ncbi:SH3 domain-containing protein [Hominenteromicrobium sp.]|uniref:SH3 domain-containing protein n=1 Tax=Hominenteromicrobium sp. TaxID=3073581 RepID=UPI0039957CCC